jgi:hypothetical protein
MAISGPVLGALVGFAPFDFVTLFVYGSFMISVWIGSRLRYTRSPWWIGGATLIGSCQFFVITNFGMWASGISVYPPTFKGLAACYVGALPFFGRTIASDLLYSAILFGLHAYVTHMTAGEAASERTAASS